MIKKVTLLLFIILLCCSSFFSCYASSVPVTKENLNSTLQQFVASDENENNYKVEVSDTAITVIAGNNRYPVKYDLTKNPTFSYTVSAKNGMSYEEFVEQTDYLILPIIGYVATANIQGVSTDDLLSYLLPLYFQYILNATSLSDVYTIVDDTVEGFKKPATADPKVIYVSEFGNKVMDIVNAMYKDTNTVLLNDSSTYNTFKLSLKKANVTNTSCDLISTLEVNLDADFSKLKVAGTPTVQPTAPATTTPTASNTKTQDQTPKQTQQPAQEQSKAQEVKEQTSTQAQVQKTSATSATKQTVNVLPKAGIKYIVYIVMFLSIVSIVIFGILTKKYRDIK